MYLWVVVIFFFLMIRRPPRSTQGVSSAASDVYKRQVLESVEKQPARMIKIQHTNNIVEARKEIFHLCSLSLFVSLSIAEQNPGWHAQEKKVIPKALKNLSSNLNHSSSPLF
eukprot:TRINITY_DN11072_c0_g1_i4.p1 TRINITY_DN11072_c0_g1~~TRINITY_DN11072_c0_g1_i4.p1  ORF type:complete len:112 (+),score=19.83 TRINITY_DN11072_c0_g1_i4:56-391(+)